MSMFEHIGIVSAIAIVSILSFLDNCRHDTINIQCTVETFYSSLLFLIFFPPWRHFGHGSALTFFWSLELWYYGLPHTEAKP